MEVERLLRIAEESPALVGNGDWTSAALASSEQIAQLYAELKRRHNAVRARAIAAPGTAPVCRMDRRRRLEVDDAQGWRLKGLLVSLLGRSA